MEPHVVFFTGAHRGTPLQNNRADYVLFSSLLILLLILLLMPSFNGRGLLSVFLLLAGGGQEGIVSGIEAS